MYRTNLRKVGGSIMLAVPPAILDMLHLKAGATVGLIVDGDHLVVAPKIKPRYTMDDLLAKCNPNAPISAEDQSWFDIPAVGSEL